MKVIDRVKLAAAAFLLMAGSWPIGSASARQTDFRDSGEFMIYSGGRQIGTEKYAIAASADAVTSTSTLEFRNSGTNQKVQLETRLDMNGRFVPVKYVLKSDVDGKKGTISGEFGRNQAMFTYAPEGGASRKSGMLVGDDYTLLDTNIFHHFLFIARLFDYSSKKPQRFEVAIPQEQESGFITVTDAGKENIVVRGKKTEARRLKVDSGSLQIDLWVDNRKMLQKIAVPGRDLEILHDP